MSRLRELRGIYTENGEYIGNRDNIDSEDYIDANDQKAATLVELTTWMLKRRCLAIKWNVPWAISKYMKNWKFRKITLFSSEVNKRKSVKSPYSLQNQIK
jgi:hypothetical protein